MRLPDGAGVWLTESVGVAGDSDGVGVGAGALSTSVTVLPTRTT